ncbi:MAG TPA: hypothetical protein VOA87_08365 [Thermoanaerobaculia bacterium]|nr:hypothetical protein [Thermoanaerobaculia bacterium]
MNTVAPISGQVDDQLPVDLEAALETLFHRQRQRARNHRELDPTWKTRTVPEDARILRRQFEYFWDLLRPVLEDPTFDAVLDVLVLNELLDQAADIVNYLVFTLSALSRSQLLNTNELGSLGLQRER